MVFFSLCVLQSELMSAVLDTPLNGLGMMPLVRTVEGLNISPSYRDALNTVVSACRGQPFLHVHFVTYVTAKLSI